jgi:hypothetical protein
MKGRTFPQAQKVLPQTDLFGMEASPSRRTNRCPESAALVEVLMALKAHPAVVWCERMNSWSRQDRQPLHSLWLQGLPGCARSIA